MAQMAGKNCTIRDNKIAQDRVKGMNYIQLAKKHGISKSRIGQILRKDDIKEIIETGSAQMVAMVPKAIDVQYQAMEITDKEGKPTILAIKASENVLKTSSVMPSNTTNQTINNVFNQQNNVITPETLNIVKGLLPGMDDINNWRPMELSNDKKYLEIYNRLASGSYGEVRENDFDEYEIEISGNESKTGNPIIFEWEMSYKLTCEDCGSTADDVSQRNFGQSEECLCDNCHNTYLKEK